MNQTCKVCGEPAAGFHFGAFTCEGCKSFFGRSYNNLSSISECKNNGECTINKKNRTACKACRLRKCLMVGMSKSGSRYGRRSNWFKIHCLLQEQQQQAAAAAAAAAVGNRKTPPPTSASINMLNQVHSGYPQGLYQRPTTKEELMLLGFEDYSNNHNGKHPSASPSVSSPDSHNSDSSVEVGDRRQLLRQSTQTQQQNRQLAPPTFNKDLFLPLSFPGLMPPPGFMPPSHLMFPGYAHPALYAQHQGLLKPAAESVALLNSAHSMVNNNSRFVPNNNDSSSKTAEELTKRYLDAVLKSQCSPNDVASNKSDNDDDDDEMDNEDIVVSMTPPTSPPISDSISRLSSKISVAATATLRDRNLSIPTSDTIPSLSSHRSQGQDAPIDLSMKSSSSTSNLSGLISTSPINDHRSDNDDANVSSEEDGNPEKQSISFRRKERPHSRSNSINTIGINDDGLRIKGTKPLDLTTKA